MELGGDNPKSRPSPDALLALARREQRGKLKIFLGSAPGVGKTYAMLQAAQARKQEKVAVVIGIVETHGRAETQALIQGLEVIPRRCVEYRGTHLDEMDLDAIRQRRPQLVLVDELAHTNAPGSRHPKRYLDVEELIAAGIDVYTTVNVQHLESLNDAVAQITGIRVGETLPDRILEQADEVQLIDLPPEELIQRLREGKVYLPERVHQAVENYFRPGNLSALRELALRRTADRVDDQMQDYMKAQAIPGPWPTTDRIMVCVSASPTSARLVRAAKRRADRRSAEWLAVCVETPADLRMTDEDRQRLDKTLRLAEQLGGEAVSIPGRKPAEDLIRYAQSRNVTEIIIGKSSRSWWQEFRYGSIVNDLIRRSGPIDVYVITGESEGRGREKTISLPIQASVVARSYVISGLVVALSGALAGGLQHSISLPNLSLVFLLGVLFVAVRCGLWPSLMACVLSALVYNFFFIPPLHTFTIAGPQETLAFAVYFIVAVIASQITARMREQADAARRREDRTSALFALSRGIAASSNIEEVAQAIVGQVHRIVGAQAVVLLPETTGLTSIASAPAGAVLTDGERAAAEWARVHNQPTGRGTDTLPGVAWSFFPLRTSHNTVGVLGVQFDARVTAISPRNRQILEGLGDQAAVGLERARLRLEMEQSRVLTETEKLRASLLSSISHDLRTPLASIIGSVSSLLSYGQDYDEPTRKDLLETIQEEAERLNRFVGNLLDITRLESGKLELNRDWAEIQDVIGSAIARMKNALAQHHLAVELAPHLPLVRIDFVLIEQVLVNLLDNAAKYSPAGTTIAVRARRHGDQISIVVADEGAGVPANELERIFDKFYRVRAADRRVAGTGLGLSICRGIVEAHGGAISAAIPPAGKGLMLTIQMPVEDQPTATEGADTHRE